MRPLKTILMFIRDIVQVIENLGIFIEYGEDDSMTIIKQQEKIDYMCNVVNSLNLKLGNDYFCKKVFMLLNKNAFFKG